MGMVSVAEAALESQVRPEIMLVRERTSYPRRPVRSRTSVAGSGADREVASATALSQDASAESGEVLAPRSGRITRDAARGVPRSPGRVTADAPREPMAKKATSAPRMRLTRRGRVVVGVLAGAMVALVAVLVWITTAARAQAASQTSAGSSGRQAMVRVVARPGQSLWAIAVQVDPSADPRIVVQQIMTDNGLSAASIRAGQVLWVPRS